MRFPFLRRVGLALVVAVLMTYGCGSVKIVKIENFEGFDDAMKSTKSCKSLCPGCPKACQEMSGRGENLCDVCLAREYTGSRVTAYTDNIYDTYNVTTALDFGLIGVATATVAAAVYKANQGTLVGIPLGGAFLGGVRTYINNGAKYDLYSSAVTALSCIKSKSNVYNAMAGDYDKAMTAEAAIQPALNHVNDALQSNKLCGISEAELKTAQDTGQQALSSADTAIRLHVGFAQYVVDTTETTEDKVFTHLKGLRPNIDEITSQITAQNNAKEAEKKGTEETNNKAETLLKAAAKVKSLEVKGEDCPKDVTAAMLTHDMTTIGDKSKEIAGYLSEMKQLDDDVQACMTGL